MIRIRPRSQSKAARHIPIPWIGLLTVSISIGSTGTKPQAASEALASDAALQIISCVAETVASTRNAGSSQGNGSALTGKVATNTAASSDAKTRDFVARSPAPPVLGGTTVKKDTPQLRSASLTDVSLWISGPIAAMAWFSPARGAYSRGSSLDGSALDQDVRARLANRRNQRPAGEISSSTECAEAWNARGHGPRMQPMSSFMYLLANVCCRSLLGHCDRHRNAQVAFPFFLFNQRLAKNSPSPRS